MRRLIASLLLFLTTIAAQAAPGVVFIENKGQWPAEVRFRADLPGGYLFLTTTGLHYTFYDTEATARRHAMPRTAAARQAAGTWADSIRAHGVAVTVVGCAKTVQLAGNHPVETRFNYFTGNDPSRWVSGARGYAEVRYEDLYPGIALRVYAYYETLKYEFEVRPGADPAQIQLAYEGATQLELANNRLTVHTSVNEFRENAPYSYTTRNARTTDVPTQWALEGHTAHFVLPNGYDRTQPLTIDPELVFVTFSGSRANNFGHAATYDAEGNTYIAGSVWDAGFTTTRGAFQVSYAGLTDVGVMKFSPDGASLLYATILGGTDVDLPHSMVVNSRGELIVMGSTASLSFPTTAGAYQATLRTQPGLATQVYQGDLTYGRAPDVFITRFNANGTALVGSTLVGGTDRDGLNLYAPGGTIQNYADEFRGEVTTGPDDDVYVATTTHSADFPVTDGSRQGGLSDGVVLRLSAELTRLKWATRIGGSNPDMAFGLRVAQNGGVYVCGTTYSAGLGTFGAMQPQLAGINDGYVARLFEGRVAAFTYLGTSASDVAHLVDIGPDNQPHVFGLSAGRYPVSAGVYVNAGSGQFIHALTDKLERTVFSTVFGSGRTGPDIVPTAFLVNTCGNIYISGWGGSVNTGRNLNAASSTTGLPTSADAYKRTTNGSNFWIGILERGAKAFLYGTFMGDTTNTAPRDGDHVDGGTCRFDPNGTIYHAACSCRSNRFPATSTAWSRTRGSTSCNNIAFKFDTDRLQAGFDTFQGTQKNVVEGCMPLTLSLQNTSVGGRRYEWVIGGKVVSTEPNRTTYTFEKAGTYPVIIRAYNPLNCKLVDSTTRTIKVIPADFRVSKDTVLCAERPVSLTAQGGITYLWTTSATSGTLVAPIANPTSASITVLTRTSTTYSVSITNEFGCSTRRTVSVKADNSFAPQITASTTSDCITPTQISFENTTTGADRFVWAMGNGDTLRTRAPTNVRYPRTGQYEVVVTAYKQDCALTQRVPIVYEDFGPLPNFVTANNDGKNDTFSVGITGARLDIYNRWGKLIFQTDNYQNNWGAKTPHGTYYYLLTTPGGSQCKGWIQVLE
jgi:gliding motility-associated-like protein